MWFQLEVLKEIFYQFEQSDRNIIYKLKVREKNDKRNLYPSFTFLNRALKWLLIVIWKIYAFKTEILIKNKNKQIMILKNVCNFPYLSYCLMNSVFNMIIVGFY